MKPLVRQLLENKSQSVPIISYPFAKTINCSAKDLVTSAGCQADVMDYIGKNCPVGAVLNPMDLSVEAESFGAEVLFPENGAPEVVKGIIDCLNDVEDIAVPEIGEARAPIFIDGIKKIKSISPDITVICGVIGPFSLAGRLFDMTELMMECFENPESVHKLLNKATEFIKKYSAALKSAGADGIMIAEPAAGLLSEEMSEEFSSAYIRDIFGCIDSETFLTGYHNCGSSVTSMTGSLRRLNADIYHFGNAIRLKDIIPYMPESSIVMGNLDPLLLKTGSPEDIQNEIMELCSECSSYQNFMISTGCDIPAEINMQNLQSYFASVKKYYNLGAEMQNV